MPRRPGPVVAQPRKRALGVQRTRVDATPRRQHQRLRDRGRRPPHPNRPLTDLPAGGDCATVNNVDQEGVARKVDVAQLLLEAARQLGETLEPERVYERFHLLLADVVPHDGIVVSSYDEADGLIRCEYAWVDGNLLEAATFP